MAGADSLLGALKVLFGEDGEGSGIDKGDLHLTECRVLLA